MDACYYCSQPGVQVACNGHVCCQECWDEGMKDWTPEQEAELNRMSKELGEWLPKQLAEIKAENGLPPDWKGCLCTRCRKPVQSDEHGNWYCDCLDERVGIDPNDPSVVPIPARFFREQDGTVNT